MRTCATDGIGRFAGLLFWLLGVFLLRDLQATTRASTARNFGYDAVRCSEMLLRRAVAQCKSSTFVLGVSSTPSLPSGGSPSRLLKFTGKERDAETGLDYFGARYFSGAQGRFTSPDVPLLDQHPEDPQSWNLYSYVRNNPLRFVDPTGQTCRKSGGLTYDDMDGSGCADVDADNARGVKNAPSRTNSAVEGNTVAHSLLLGALAEGVQRAEAPVNALGLATGVVTGGAGVAALASGGTSLMSLGAIVPHVTSGGTATSFGYQMLKDSYRNLELVGEALSGIGQRVIASGTGIHEVQRLVSQYGGQASDWVKLSTRGLSPSSMQIYAQTIGRGAPVQIHYYKNVATGQVVELKSVMTAIPGK